MIVLYVGGTKVGTWAEAERLLPEYAAQGKEVELRDDAGKLICRAVPPEPICPWEPSLTAADFDRMSAEGGGMSLAEFWKRMGVQ